MISKRTLGCVPNSKKVRLNSWFCEKLANCPPLTNISVICELLYLSEPKVLCLKITAFSSVDIDV